MSKAVKMYTLSTCGHCKATKELMQDLKIEYDFIDVDLLDVLEKAETIREIKKVNPRCTFPTIIIGDKVIVGYREQEIKEALES